MQKMSLLESSEGSSGRHFLSNFEVNGNEIKITTVSPALKWRLRLPPEGTVRAGVFGGTEDNFMIIL